MSYISEIFDRLDIQHIREFLLHGVEEMNVSAKGYKERIEEARTPAIDFIRQKFPDMREYEEVTDKFYSYATACQDVYMEIGLQCGLVLAMQIMLNTKQLPENEVSNDE